MAHGETYDEFVAKFNKEKPKTTDDCYTPREIYEVVLDWCKEHLNIGGRPVVRPFYPGGDFENYDYPENCVVVDNPPFSIFAKILKWYNARSIDFFLFAPSLTSIREGVTFVSVDADIIYENGARVNHAFVTNMMGNLLCITAPELNESINEANMNRQLSLGWIPQKKYAYPKSVLRASTINCMTRRGIHFSVSANEGSIASKVTTAPGGEYGNSIILCERKKNERENLFNEPIPTGYIERELNEQAKAEIDRLNALDRDTQI